jgi:hypothetical protein
MADLWTKRTAQLIRDALGEDHYDVETFTRAGAGSYSMITGYNDAERDRVRLDNVRRAINPHIPPLDDAIVQAEKLLGRMGGAAVPAAPAGGAAASLPSVDFAALRDPKLKAMAERDYRELRVAVFYQSDKSMALLAGSVIEAIVLDLLLQKAIPFDEVKGMSAFALYERARKEGFLQGRQFAAADASRDTRNFVHPGVEYREGALTHHQAELGVALMKAVLSELGYM